MEIKGMGHPSWPTRLTPSGKVEDNSSFREVLESRISQTNPAFSATGQDSKTAFLEQGERVLDLLDNFAQALADPEKTLRELEPLVLKMEGEVRPLEAATGVEGDSDRSLSRLINDVSLLAKVTLMKFHRGDYL